MDIKDYLNESDLLQNGTCGFYDLRGGVFHYHRQIEILYIEKGTLHITTPNKTLQLHAKQFAVIKPYELHRFYNQKRNDCTCPILSDYYSNKLSQLNFESCILDDPDGEILRVFKLYKEFNKLSAENRKLYFSLIYKIVKERLPIGSNEDEKQLDMIFKYIHTHYDKPITIAQISSACSTNCNYVSTRINQHVSMNFNSYINHLRLTKFIDSFQGESCKIADCAHSVGCRSMRTFYRAFKQEYGTTPKAYFALIATN